MKKLLSILLLGSFAIAQAGFTDYLQSGWSQTKSAAPAVLVLGSFAAALSEPGWKRVKPTVITGIGSIVGALAAHMDQENEISILDGLGLGTAFGLMFAVADEEFNKCQKPFAFGFLTVPRLALLGAAAGMAGCALAHSHS